MIVKVSDDKILTLGIVSDLLQLRKASIFRSARPRNMAFNFENAFSMGLKSEL